MDALARPAGLRLSLECGRDRDFCLIHMAFCVSQQANSSLSVSLLYHLRISFILSYNFDPWFPCTFLRGQPPSAHLLSYPQPCHYAYIPCCMYSMLLCVTEQTRWLIRGKSGWNLWEVWVENFERCVNNWWWKRLCFLLLCWPTYADRQ